jgi:predicted chitinase
MKITEQQLRRAVPGVSTANLPAFVKTFNEWAEKFGINTPLRVVHYLAQVFHESGNLRHREENLNYSADGLLKVFPKYFKTRQDAVAYAYRPQAIANRVYANRMGNGSEASGDGWRFKGRGYIGTTGRANYKAYADSEFCKGDLMAHPEWLAQNPGDQKSAMYFWYKNGLNELADRDNVEAVTKRVNGGYNGLANRMYLYRIFKKEFGL